MTQSRSRLRRASGLVCFMGPSFMPLTGRSLLLHLARRGWANIPVPRAPDGGRPSPRGTFSPPPGPVHWARGLATGVTPPAPPGNGANEAVMHRVLSLILGGGRGTRLYPLTALRSKPAVPVG